MGFHFRLNLRVKLEGNFCLICTFLNTFEKKLFLIEIKQQNHRNQFTLSCSKKKDLLKETSQATKKEIKKVNIVFQ